MKIPRNIRITSEEQASYLNKNNSFVTDVPDIDDDLPDYYDIDIFISYGFWNDDG